MMKENTSCPMNLPVEFLNRSIGYLSSCEDEEAPFRGTWDHSAGPLPPFFFGGLMQNKESPEKKLPISIDFIATKIFSGT